MSWFATYALFIWPALAAVILGVLAYKLVPKKTLAELDAEEEEIREQLRELFRMHEQALADSERLRRQYEILVGTERRRKKGRPETRRSLWHQPA